MYYKNSDLPHRPKGRPVEGAERRTVCRQVRLEPYLDQELGRVCHLLGATKSEAIRQGILLFLREAKHQYGI